MTPVWNPSFHRISKKLLEGPCDVPQQRIPLPCNVICLMIYIISCLEPMFSSCHLLADSWPSVDGWNPKQPPGMYKTLQIMGEATNLNWCRISAINSLTASKPIKELSPKNNSSSPGIPVLHWVETLGILAHRNREWFHGTLKKTMRFVSVIEHPNHYLRIWRDAYKVGPYQL